MAKRFRYLDTEWEAVSSGVGTGAGFFGDTPPPLTSHSVVFRSQWGEFRGTISEPDPADAPENDLRRALSAELERRVIGVIESQNIVWRPAEAISKQTGIPVEQVRQILENATTAEVIRAPFPNPQGFLLYTTREHYRKLTPFLKRYADIVRGTS